MEPPDPRPDTKPDMNRAAHTTGDDTPPVRYRTITPADLPAATQLLTTVGGVTMAGLFGASLDRAFCREALRDGPFRLIVADRGGTLLGFVLAVIDPIRSYRAFLGRHPLWALRLVARRLQTRRHRESSAEAAETHSPASDWDRSGADSARIITVGVAETARGLGIGTSLYYALFDDLASRGVALVLARIVPDNLPSIQLHRRTGWNIIDLGHTLEATRDLRTLSDRPSP